MTQFIGNVLAIFGALLVLIVAIANVIVWWRDKKGRHTKSGIVQ